MSALDTTAGGAHSGPDASGFLLQHQPFESNLMNNCDNVDSEEPTRFSFERLQAEVQALKGSVDADAPGGQDLAAAAHALGL